MSNDRLHITFKAEDIEQYFLGKLPPSAMHDMEMAALDDPFLSAAMEGYSAMEDSTWKKELIAARNEIAAKGADAKVVTFPAKFNWKKAVAAILIVSCGAALVYKITNNVSSKKDVVEIAAIKTPADTIKKDSISAGLIATPGQVNIAPSRADTNYKTLIASAKPKAAAGNNSINTYKKSRQQQTVKDAQHVADTSVMGYAAAPVTVNNSTSPVRAFSDTKNTPLQNGELNNTSNKGPVLNQRFSAQVIARDNTPLAFANVLVKQENFGTYADVKGKFGLVGSDSTLTVEVRAAGYQPQTYVLKSGSAQNNIVLNEVQLPPDDIIHLKNKNKSSPGLSTRRAMQMDTVLDVEPSDGWKNYNTYLSNNLELPDDILKKNIHGEVEVSFDVQSNGNVSNVNIAKSLCSACDEEALRVIKQGPQWKVKKGKKEKGKVKIKF